MFKKALSIFFLTIALGLIYSSSQIYAARDTSAKERATSSGQIRSCEARMENVRTRSMNMAEHANRLMGKFQAIDLKVDEFYRIRLLENNLEVENYDELKTQVQARQREVERLMTQAQNQAGAFNCDSDNPRGQVQEFGASMKEVVSALRAYKTAVRNMLVAVHRVSLGLGEES